MIRRHSKKKGFTIVRDPHGRYCKTRNLKFIPKGWKVFENYDNFYGKSGELTEIVHCVVDITSKKHAEWFESPRNLPIGIVFGRLTDA